MAKPITIFAFVERIMKNHPDVLYCLLSTARGWQRFDIAIRNPRDFTSKTPHTHTANSRLANVDIWPRYSVHINGQLMDIPIRSLAGLNHLMANEYHLQIYNQQEWEVYYVTQESLRKHYRH